MTKSRIVKFFKTIGTLGVLLFVFYQFEVDLDRLFLDISNENYVLLDLLIPLFILPIVSARRWNVFLEQINIKERTLPLIKIGWISIFQGLILPSSQGQDLFRIYYIEKRHPDKRGAAGSTVVIERLMGFIILCLLCMAFSYYNYSVFNQKEFILIISLVSLFVFTIAVLISNKRLQAYAEKKTVPFGFLQKGFSYLSRMHRTISYFPYNRIIFSSVFLILLFQMSTITSVYLVFKAYGIDIPLYVHIAVYPVITILSMIPVTISGLGIREGFFVYFYAQFGVPAETAVFVSLVNYAIIVLLPAVLGSLFFLHMTLFKKETI